MQAIVLAGGLGTRLRAVVPDLPKPMAPVGGRPFLAWVLDRLADAGCERTVLAVGYRHEAILDHFGAAHRGMALRYSVETTPLGTGGAIRAAAEQIDRYPVLVLNGDTYLDLDFHALLTAHKKGKVGITVAACRVVDVSRYGTLALDGSQIRGFHEKGGTGSGYINAGVYLLDSDIIEQIPAGEAFSFEQQLLVPRVQTLQPLAFRTDGLFIDIGVPEDYARAQKLLASLDPTDMHA
jgi:D-glycero-alpha-D-manno-heptose 1-phosphate guanylyltransferase